MGMGEVLTLREQRDSLVAERLEREAFFARHWSSAQAVPSTSPPAEALKKELPLTGAELERERSRRRSQYGLGGCL